MTSIVAALIVLAIDLATKSLAAAGTVSASWIEPGLNPDFALGVVGGPTAIEITAAALALGGAIAVLRRAPRSALSSLAVGLIVGASLGNLADRLAFGSVRDFIVGPGILFNVADVALVVGIAAIAWAVARREPVAAP